MFFSAEDSEGLIFNQMDQDVFLEASKTPPGSASVINSSGGKYKAFVSVVDESGIRVTIASSEERHLSSNSIFRREAISLVSIIKDASVILREEKVRAIEKSKEMAKSQAIKLIHNLKTLNAQNSQAVYLVIPQDVMNSSDRKLMNTKDFVSSLTNYVEDQKVTTVKSLMRIAKNSMQFKSEIDVYNALINNDFRIKIRAHSIHRVIMNAFYVFFADFTDSFVNVKIGESNSSARIDYDTFQVAIYYIIENTSKYILPKTDLLVRFDHDKQSKKITLSLSMISLRIAPEEVDMIFSEGFSGNEAVKAEKNGNGIGLNRCRSLLEHSNATIRAEIAPQDFMENHYGRTYQRNKFIIEMNAD